MEEASSKELQYDYRDYLENNDGIPNGTEIAHYKIVRQIGKGAFGKIYLAKNSRGEDVAVKLMDLQKIRRESNPKIQEIRWRLVKNEPALMQKCNSPNVLRCYDVFENQSLKVLILQYCNGHTLQEYIDRKIRIKQEEAVRILRQIINGIAQLHKHSIIHRDLKADNIMQHEGQYKIIDLGFSKQLDIAHQKAQVKGTILGTVTTMAPEVLSKLSYGLKADIWSIGVIFFQMVFGILLYDSVSARQRLKEIQQKRYFSLDKELTFNGITISVNANNFLYRALQVDTQKRLSWRQMLDHPLIKQKDAEPLGDRFLVQNQLQMPDINEDLKVEPTIRVPIQEENVDQEELNMIERFSPTKEEEMQKGREKHRIENQQAPKIENKKKTEGNKKNGFKIDMESIPKDRFEIPNRNWKTQEQVEDERRQTAKFNVLPVPSPPKQKPVSSLIHQNHYPKQQDSADYKWVKLAHLQCLKTQLIYHQLIIPIQRDNLLDLSDRDVVEFMFLITARCFQNVSPLSLKVEIQKYRVNPIVKNLHQQVKDLYQKVREKFQEYSQKLTKVQNGFFQMFLDFFRKRFLKKNYEEKSKITSGIEVPEEKSQQKIEAQNGQENKKEADYGDYSKVEQINYTYSMYASNILQKLTNNKKAAAATVEKVSGYLRYYDRICLVTIEELDGETFGEYVRRIIL